MVRSRMLSKEYAAGEGLEEEEAENKENSVVRQVGVLPSLLRGLSWPFRLMVRAYRGFWWVVGFRQSRERIFLSPAASRPPVPGLARHSLAGRKRLNWVTRLLLCVVPRWVQGALGYPVSSNIGLSVSPEIRISPTKPCGKGSKRKQDELDEEDEDEVDPRSWVDVLSQELFVDEGPEEDPDYEPSSVETESGEFCSHSTTESDVDVLGEDAVIEDLDMGRVMVVDSTEVP
ncbi:oogenesis-related [Brachyistius frenatus]|uniref:oogenesis-related n=1 Tax=Brachyistius frenatus TaxID=100188 RepID=UPI0037E99C0C